MQLSDESSLLLPISSSLPTMLVWFPTCPNNWSGGKKKVALARDLPMEGFAGWPLLSFGMPEQGVCRDRHVH